MFAGAVTVLVFAVAGGSSGPSAVSVPVSSTVADVRVFHAGAWLRAGQLPYGKVMHWRLLQTKGPGTCCAEGFGSSCGVHPQNQILTGEQQTVPGPVGGQDEWFRADDVSALGIETQYFYRTPADARAAFAAYVTAFDVCVQAWGRFAPNGMSPGVVKRSVRRTVSDASAGAWLHRVRYSDGSPAYSLNVEVLYSDNHEYAVVRGNVLAILALGVNAPVIDDTAPDTALVQLIGDQLASYDGPPGRAAFPVDPTLELWQPWPSLESLPTTAGWAWRSGPAGPGTETSAVANVACTPVPPDGPDLDLTLTGRANRGYGRYPTGRGGVGEPDSGAQVDLFFYTSARTAAAHYAALLGDLRSCQSRLRRAQTTAGLPADAVVAQVSVAPGVGVWAITATGVPVPFPGKAAPNSQIPAGHLVVLIVRGPLLESFTVDISGADASVFTPAADRAIAAAAVSNLCQYDVSC